MEPPRLRGKGVNVGLGQRGGDAIGGFNLEVIAGQEKGACRMEDTGSRFEGLAFGLELPLGAHGFGFPVIP